MEALKAFLVVNITNTGIALLLWVSNRTRLNRTLLYYWLSAVLLMIVQMMIAPMGPFIKTQAALVAFLQNLILAHMIGLILGFVIPWRLHAGVISAGLALTALLHSMRAGPFIFSIPATLAVAFPPLYASHEAIRRRRNLTFATKGLVLTNALYGVQILTFPYGLAHPDFMIFGFWGSFFLTLLISTFAPASTIEALTKENAKIHAEKEAERQHKAILLEMARQSGKAEVASSVLHNVGNVLNSVNVSVQLVRDKVSHLKFKAIGESAKLLSEEGGSEKNRELARYLAKLGDQFLDRQGEMSRELDVLSGNIEHINGIIAWQQSNAKSVGVVEEFSVRELLNQAIQINADSLARHQIEVICAYEGTGVATQDRHQLLQILINLISNAKNALAASESPARMLTIRCTNAGEWCEISIQDNGIGISSENLMKIFSPGFTTRKEGHGFGLHSGALTAKQLGGNLCAQSEGVGKGACFVLRFPVQAPAHSIGR